MTDFLARLKAARQKKTHGGLGAELAALLVDNAEKIERLIEALQIRADHECRWPMEECRDPDCTPQRVQAEEVDIWRAFAALNRAAE